MPEVVPQMERAAPPPRTRRTEPTRRLEPGDLVCGQCGEGNEPSRKFCSRCGESLIRAETVAFPWWRRWLQWIRDRLPGGLRTRKSGATPIGSAETGPDGRRKRSRKLQTRAIVRRVQTAVGTVIIVFGLLAAFYPPLRTTVVGWYEGAARQVTSVVAGQTLSPVRPVAVADVGRSDPQHPATLAFDGFTNTYWAAPFADESPPTVTVDLGKPTALMRVIVHSGDPTRFTELDRPSLVSLTYSNEKSDTITLKDTPEAQQISLDNALGAQTVRIRVLDRYGAQQPTQVALSEMEFFAAGG